VANGRIKRIAAPILSAAKEHRRTPTPAEERLWESIRGRQIDGFPFRRQHPVTRFILDFYCPRRKLCIELDGAIHDEQRDYDDARTEALARMRIRVIRFRNEEVLQDLPSVLHRIREALSPTKPASIKAPSDPR
jgi:very-short-patch-repair endonuclease